MPISGKIKQIIQPSPFHDNLKKCERITLRLGKLRFRGFERKKDPLPNTPVSDNNFEPTYEQKGVDMLIGLDIAHYSLNRLVDRIILITNDADIVPAMETAQRNGVQIITVSYYSAAELVHKLQDNIIEHSDFTRKITIVPPS